MTTTSPQIPLIHPRLPLLARTTGLTLMVVFGLIVIASALPITPRSIPWAGLVSNRIIDATSLALVGVALLRFATLLEPQPEPKAGRQQALSWARRRDQALGLARLGMVGLALLAIGQIPLFMVSVNALDRESNARSAQLSQGLAQAEQLVRRAPADQLQQQWQQQNPAAAPQLFNAQTQRQALLKQIQGQQRQAGITIKKRTDELRFQLVRDIVRNVLIGLTYCAAFLVLSGRSG